MAPKKASQTQLGKAFEFACLDRFVTALQQAGCDIQLVKDEPYNTAESYYSEKLSAVRQANYRAAAQLAFAMIEPLEPCLLHGNDRVILSIQPDSAAIGSKGDVRDVLCERNSWNIGFSCKHNHEALKHPRITKDYDFGKAWMGIPCSDHFKNRMHSILHTLPETKTESTQEWATIEDKFDRYYVPILEAFKDEFFHLTKINPQTPEKMMGYFIGSHDFYKIEVSEKGNQSRGNRVEVIAFNQYGSLNQPAGGYKPAQKAPRAELPNRILDISFEPNASNIIDVTFNGGWAVSLRIHNKDKKAFRTSLAWDVQLIGYPRSLFNESRFLPDSTVESNSVANIISRTH